MPSTGQEWGPEFKVKRFKCYLIEINTQRYFRYAEFKKVGFNSIFFIFTAIEVKVCILAQNRPVSADLFWL